VKPEIFRASIEKGTNKLYTLCHKQVITQNGAFIKMGENDIFYRVESCEKLTIKRKFTTEGNKLVLKGNFDFKISDQDTLQIYITEYEAVSYGEIKPHDTHYKQGEKIYAQGGVTSSSDENLTGEYASFEVVDVNKNNNITDLHMINGGRYMVPPTNPVQLMNQDEQVMEIDMEFDISTQTLSIEREVILVEGNEKQTEIMLSYNLPSETTGGEILVSKQIIYIDKPYTAESFESEPCQITFDYTPVNGIPLLPPNSLDPSTTYNKGMEIIDARLLEIEKRLTRIENMNY